MQLALTVIRHICIIMWHSLLPPSYRISHMLQGPASSGLLACLRDTRQITHLFSFSLFFNDVMNT